MILKCDCLNDFQDDEYGKNMRLHNPCQKGARCTVCLKEVKADGEDKKAKKK